MNKYDIVGYLANLHFVLEGQEKQALQRSQVLAAEYQKHWNMLKGILKKEKEDEARLGKDGDGSKEGSSARPGDQSGLRGADRQGSASRGQAGGDD